MSIRQSREYAIRSIIESGIENEVSRDEFHFYNYCTSFGFKERMYACRDDLQRALDEVKNNKEQEINDKEQEIENTAADDENLAELENDLEHLQDEYDELQSADDLLTRLGYGIEEFDEYDNGESLETIVDLVNQLDSAFVDIPTGYGRGVSDLHDTIKNWRESPANPDNGLVGKCFEPTDEETLLDIVATDGFKKWFRPEMVASELKESRLLPKVWYRGLSGVSGEEVDKLKATSKYSDYAGEYYAYTPATAMSYIGDLTNGKLLAGFLNVPEDKLAVLDCKGSSFADIGFKSTVAEQCEVFLAFGFDEEPNNWQDFDFVQTVKLAKTKDTISFYLQYANARGCLLVVDKDFEEQEYSQNRLAEYFSGRVEYALEHNYTKTNFYAWNLAIRGDYWAVMFENIHDFGGNYGKELRGTIGQDDIICVFAPNAYFKEIHNKGEFNPEDNRIFYSLFDIEQDFKQEKTEKDKTMENQTLSGSPEQELPKYNKYIARYIRDFVNDDSNFHAWKGDKVKWSGWASLYYLEKLANRNGGIEHFAKLFEQYKSRNRIDFNQTWRYRYMDETIKMLRNPVLYKEQVEQSLSKIRQELKEIDAELHRDENFNTPEHRKLRETFDELLSVQSIAMDKLTVIEDHIQTLQRKQENQTMQQTQATQQTAAQGGFSSPKNYEKTVNYDVRGLPAFSGSVAAYFNNSQRQELVLAFKQTLERSFDLRHQHFIGIHPKQQVQFDRIAAFSPLELSAILDCKPEFTNNMREYMAVINDFEQNHQQKLADFKKALHALKISPKYQAATTRNRIFDESDLRKEYIDGGEKFARAKTGEITNGDRLKQAIANAIDAIAPAVKYSLSQQDFWQERDDLSFIVQPQIRNLLRQEMGFPAELVEVKTRHQIWYEDRAVFDTLSNNTSGFFTPKNGKTVIVADAFIKRPELAVFTAYHELGHRGIELQGRELWNEWLEKARQNPTVRAIADHAQVHYASKGNILSDIAATEEALVEVFAAYKTQNWDYLAERHNVEISQEFKKPQGTAEKLWNAAKNKIGQIFGRQSETVSDAAVFAMLGKLEQSLYQFPEWKQKLEKAVRVGQHNPFTVAKQPIISGSLRVNPTALTNRYRSGGLRFDLNTQDNSEFAKAVDDIAANGKPKGTFFNLGTTPEVWQLIGIQDMPVDIHSDVMIKSVSEYLNLPPQYYRDGREKGQHNLSPETLKQIPAQLNNPVAIFKSADTSTNPNGYVVLTELIEHDFNTGKEKPVIAALDIRKVGQQKIEVVNITSIYGRWDWQIEKAVEHLDKQGNKASDLLYWHTTKGHQLSNSFGLRLPTWLNSLDDLSNRNIKTEQDLLQYQKDKEMEKNQQQGTTTPEISENTVKFDAFSQSEKENTMNETEKQALAQAFKNLKLPDRKYVVKGSLVEFQDRPESEIIAALAWDEFATAVKDYVNSQSDENAEKLSNAYMVYPFYNELANKGIRDDSSLRNQYAKVIESKFSSFNERRTAALFILQSMWRGRGNSTDITRSYNIDAMTAYIARGRELRSGWRLENRVNEYFLTKNSIFTHKNLREMGLDNNPNLAPYAPELLQEMVKIERQHRVFSQWQNQNSEGGWYNRGAENIIDFKQIPAAVQKDLILMVSDRYLSKRDMFGVYDNPVISMQHGLAVRSEVQRNLEILIGQQEKELQQYQKMGLGVPVPQEDAIVQQINAYKETLEQVKNAPAVAFVPETLFVVGETKPDWQTGEVQRYNTTEINTATGEITFVNDPNNPNPTPFGDMTEQARQYLSANNNFTLAALGVAPKEMPENVKFDMNGLPEKQEQTMNTGNQTAEQDDIFEQVVELQRELDASYDFLILYQNDDDEKNINAMNLRIAELKKELQALYDRLPERVYDEDGSVIAKPTETAVQNELNRQHGSVLSAASESQIAELVDLKLRADTIAHENTVLYKKWNGFSSYTDESNPDYNPAAVKDWQQWLKNKEPMQALNQELHQKIAHIAEQQQRIEKREQVFNMIAASGVMNTAWNGDETHGTESVLDTPFINKSLYYQDGELVYKDANYEHFETPDIFKISKQDFERHSPQAIALAVMKGVEEYKKMYRPEKAPEQSPTKRNDLQHTVNVGLQQYDNMFSPEIQKTHRLDILASQEKHRSHSVSGSLNEVKQDAFGLPESEKPSLETMGEIQRQGAEKFISEKIDNGTYHNTPLQIVKAEMRYALGNQLVAELDMQLTNYKDMYAGWDIEDYTKENEEETYRMFMPKIGNALENIMGEYERVKEKVANFFDIEKSQVADFLNYKEPTEKFELAQKLITDAKSLKTEQALQDGKALSAAEKKVADTKWALAKQPNNTERKTAYEQAQAELTALKSEIKERVQAAMDKGVPYIARYSEFPREPFNNAKAPIEFAITPKGELTEVIGTTDTPHNLVPSNAGQGVVLNTEQRSSPQRIAEVLREHYQKSGILMQLDAINAVGGDKVFSEQEIKKTLNRALKDYHPSSIRGALESPRMKDEWLQVVIDKHPNAEIKQAAQRVLEQRQGNLSQKPTAANGGVSLSTPQQHTTQQPVVAKQVMQSPTAVKTHRMRH